MNFCLLIREINFRNNLNTSKKRINIFTNKTIFSKLPTNLFKILHSSSCKPTNRSLAVGKTTTNNYYQKWINLPSLNTNKWKQLKFKLKNSRSKLQKLPSSSMIHQKTLRLVILMKASPRNQHQFSLESTPITTAVKNSKSHYGKKSQ